MKNIKDLKNSLILGILFFLLAIGVSSYFFNFETAYADSPNQIPSEYTPQGLNSSSWVITDEYSGNVLKNLTDNNPATYSTIVANPSTGATGFVVNLRSPTAVDRIYLTGPKSSQGQSANERTIAFGDTLPIGMIRVYVGNTPTPTTQVAELMVPYNAGNPVDIDADLRFQPVVGQYLRVELQTADIIWANFSVVWPKTLTPPACLPWDVGEIEVHGFAGQTNATPQEVLDLPADAEIIPLLIGMMGNMQDSSDTWNLKKRMADILAGFNWILSQRQLTTSNMNNLPSYQTIGEDSQEIDLNLANGIYPTGQSLQKDGGISTSSGLSVWNFQGAASIYELLNFAQGGVYKINIQAYSTAIGGNHLSNAYAYLGPILLGTIDVTSQTPKDFIFTVSVPDHFGIQDFLISMGLGTGPMNVSKVSITRM